MQRCLFKGTKLFCRRACRSVGRHSHGYNYWSNTTLYRISPKQKVSVLMDFRKIWLESIRPLRTCACVKKHDFVWIFLLTY